MKSNKLSLDDLYKNNVTLQHCTCRQLFMSAKKPIISRGTHLLYVVQCRQDNYVVYSVPRT